MNALSIVLFNLGYFFISNTRKNTKIKHEILKSNNFDCFI